MAPKPVRIMCPNLVCRTVLAVPQTARGKTVRCRACGTNIKVPAEAKVNPSTQKDGADSKAA
ncbi:MAG: hypothetical protein PSX37_06575 [bacterium]|nr:hypothetical protein [bacterium]